MEQSHYLSLSWLIAKKRIIDNYIHLYTLRTLLTSLRKTEDTWYSQFYTFSRRPDPLYHQLGHIIRWVTVGVWHFWESDGQPVLSCKHPHPFGNIHMSHAILPWLFMVTLRWAVMSSLSIVDGDFPYEMRNAWKTPGTRQVQSCSAVREAQTLIEKNV